MQCISTLGQYLLHTWWLIEDVSEWRAIRPEGHRQCCFRGVHEALRLGECCSLCGLGLRRCLRPAQVRRRCPCGCWLLLLLLLCVHLLVQEIGYTVLARRTGCHDGPR
jgi:hypothetical protein